MKMSRGAGTKRAFGGVSRIWIDRVARDVCGTGAVDADQVDAPSDAGEQRRQVVEALRDDVDDLSLPLYLRARPSSTR